MKPPGFGINFTASFNPPEYNGLKFNTEKGAPAMPEETDKIEAEIKRLARDYSYCPYYPKSEFIERIDHSIEILASLQGVLLVITADHSTPCSLMTHSADPVPICFHGLDVRTDDVKELGERACASGGLGRMVGLEVITEIINILGLSLPLARKVTEPSLSTTTSSA